MNLTETHDLLTFIATVDNRRFDDATVLAWQPMFADLPFDDCRAAVREHFSTSDAYLMPVHVRRIAATTDRDRKRAAREHREQLAAIEADRAGRSTDRSDEIADIIGHMRAMLPEGHPEKLRRPEWLEWERNQARQARADAEPNPEFRGFPPPEGHPTESEGEAA